MIKNHRLSRFNENRGLRRRYNEDNGSPYTRNADGRYIVDNQEDYRMIGVAGMKFAAVAKNFLKKFVVFGKLLLNTMTMKVKCNMIMS